MSVMSPTVLASALVLKGVKPEERNDALHGLFDASICWIGYFECDQDLVAAEAHLLHMREDTLTAAELAKDGIADSLGNKHEVNAVHSLFLEASHPGTFTYSHH